MTEEEFVNRFQMAVKVASSKALVFWSNMGDYSVSWNRIKCQILRGEKYEW